MVFDFSAASPSTDEKGKSAKVVKSATSAPKVEKVTKDLEEEGRFKDSWGTGHRKYSDYLHHACSHLPTRP